MIDSEIVMGTGLRITASRDDLAAKLALVARGVSTRTTVLVLGGIQLRAEAGRLHLAADRHGLPRCARPSRRKSRTKALPSCRAACCTTSFARCPASR